MGSILKEPDHRLEPHWSVRGERLRRYYLLATDRATFLLLDTRIYQGPLSNHPKGYGGKERQTYPVSQKAQTLLYGICYPHSAQSKEAKTGSL